MPFTLFLIIMTIKKRDGSIEEFDFNKVKRAIEKAFMSVGQTPDDAFLDDLNFLKDKMESEQDLSVESIQNSVELFLMQSGYYNVAKSYIIYREKHKNIRDWANQKIKFIEKYKQSDNTANATIDDNSNVASKNIGILNAEIHKNDNISISRSMVVNKLKELYPDFESKSYIDDLNSHIIYKHDESSFAGAISPYTYSCKEVVNVKYNDHNLLVPFDSLWDVLTEEEVLVDAQKIVYQKYPENLFVLDRDNNWTEVTHVTKKLRHRDLVRVKTSFGEDIVVTDNHPMIVDIENIDNNVEAINAIGMTQYKINDGGGSFAKDGLTAVDMSESKFVSESTETYCFNQNEHTNCWCKRYVKLDWNLGYFVGFFIGDGNYDNTDNDINFTQNDREVLLKLNSILYKSIGVAGRIYCKKDLQNCYNLSISSDFLYWLLKDYFKIQDKAQNKTIPFNVYETNEEFAKGILCGIIDADGTVNGSQLQIRLASRACVMQCSYLLRHFGYNVGNTMQSLPFSNNLSYTTNYTIWGVNCSVRGCSVNLGNSYKLNKVIKTTNTPKYKISGETKIVNIQKLSDNDSFIRDNEFIFDITTSTHTFALNNLLVHNCSSITMYPFLINGIKGLGGLSAKPKNLDSFCGMYINLIFATSSMFAGAVASSEFLLYFDYFARKQWGNNYYEKPDVITTSEHVLRKMTIRNEIHQYFQQVIYSINQPASARGMQSAFVNFSYFDKPFFEAMFGEFCFPDGTKPIWESLNWLQKEFMVWFNNERLKTIITFPVESFALIYKDGKFEDEESAKFVAEEYARGHSFFTYISDTADSLSSCCFKGDEVIKIYDKDGKIFSTTIEDFVNYNNSDICKDGNTCLKSDFYIDSYNLSGEKERVKITGTLKKEYTGVMYTFNTGEDSITITADHELMVKNNKGEIISKKAEDVAKSIEDYELVVVEMNFKKIMSVQTNHVEKQVVYDIELQKNHYFVANNIVSHNCRLKNKVQTKEFNFTNGNLGVQTGSKSVITINLNRILQDFWKNKKSSDTIFTSLETEFQDYLNSILERVLKYHVAYNELLWDMYNANLLPVYKSGFINLDKQYLTYGINGLNSAAEFLGFKCTNNEDYKMFCKIIFKIISSFCDNHNGVYFNHKVTLNVEQVPAESLGLKNFNWDKEDGYYVGDGNLYTSYIFKPNDPNVSVLDKLIMHSKQFASNELSGGQAAHINLDHHLDSEQYWKLLNFAGKVGCSYFTFNIPNSECDDCGYITKVPIKQCPKCGSEKISYYDRVIG